MIKCTSEVSGPGKFVTTNSNSISIIDTGKIDRRYEGGSKPKGSWNFEVEMAKIIERGLSIGYFNVLKNGNESRVRTEGGLRDNNSSWSFSEEVAKIIETGVAICFDFNGICI